jgi:hypothetical protein
MKNNEIPQNTFKRVQYAHTNLILTKINTFNQDKMQWHYKKQCEQHYKQNIVKKILHLHSRIIEGPNNHLQTAKFS